MVQLMRRKFDNTSSPDHTITHASFDAIIGNCESVTDKSRVNFARELIEAFPEAKGIVHTRERDSTTATNQRLSGTKADGAGSIAVQGRGSAPSFIGSSEGEYNFEMFWNGNLYGTTKWRHREHVAMIEGASRRTAYPSVKSRMDRNPFASFQERRCSSRTFRLVTTKRAMTCAWAICWGTASDGQTETC